jgi:hypothetical protein
MPFTPEQRAAVAHVFAQNGYLQSLRVAPVTSDDERVFVVPEGTTIGERAVADLQTILGRKVWIVEESKSWPETVPFE